MKDVKDLVFLPTEEAEGVDDWTEQPVEESKQTLEIPSEEVKDEDIDDWEEREVTEDTQFIGRYALPKSYLEKGGQVEAVMKGGAQGVTFGGYPILAGGVEAAAEKLGGSERDLLDIYTEAKKKEQEELDLLRTKYPAEFTGSEILASTAVTGGLGSLAGKLAQGGKLSKGIASILPSTADFAKDASTASRLGRGTMEGAKIGGMYGFTQGQADLAQGDVAGTVQDVLSGGLYGAGTGLLTQGAFETIPAIKKGVAGAKEMAEEADLVGDYLTGRKWGTKGKPLTDKAIEEQSEKVASKLLSSIKSKLSKLGLDKKAQKELAEEMQIRLNLGEPFEEAAEKAIEKVAITTDALKNKQDLQNVVKQLSEGIPKSQAKITKQLEISRAKQGLKNKGAQLGDIEEFTDPLSGRQGQYYTQEVTDKYGDVTQKVKGVGVGERKLDKIDITNLSLDEAERVLEAIRFNKNPEIRKELNVLEREIRQAIENQLEGKPINLLDINEKLSKLMSAQGRLGVLPKSKRPPAYERQRQQLDTLQELMNPDAQRNVKTGYQYLKEVDPKFSKIEEAQELVTKVSRLKKSAGEGKSATKAGIIGRGLGFLGNIQGLAEYGTKKAVQSSAKQMVDLGSTLIKKATPESLQRYGQRFMDKGTKAGAYYGKQLIDIAKKPGVQRTAALNGLMQQPAFREMVRREEEE